MGYTKGRRHTNESLAEIAKQYKTKREFVLKDSSAFVSARKRGIVDEICSHMAVSFSTPQLMCKLILETVLSEKCIYNGRKAIKPLELDIHFPQYNFAVEYNGDRWHDFEECAARDKRKQEACKEKGITLIYIVQRSRDWECDVKTQLVDLIPKLNHLTGKNITSDDITNTDCSSIYDDITLRRDPESLKAKILSCKNVTEFMKKFSIDYKYITNSKNQELLNALDSIRERHVLTNEELLKECRKITDRTAFTRDHSDLYLSCWKRGLLEEATQHMHKVRGKYLYHTDAELLELVKGVPYKSNLSNDLRGELEKRGLLERCDFSETPRKKKADRNPRKPNSTHKQKALVRSSKDYTDSELVALASGYLRSTLMPHDLHYALKKRKLLSQCVYSDGTTHKVFLWTKELLRRCREITDYNEFTANKYLYNKCVSRGILKAASAHMTRGKKRVKLKHSNEELLDRCKDVQSHKELIKDHFKLYQLVKRRGIFEEATKHMAKTHYQYTDKELVEIASKYTKKTVFLASDPIAYNQCYRKGLLDEVTKHMIRRTFKKKPQDLTA